jgi:hypothetical protein
MVHAKLICVVALTVVPVEYVAMERVSMTHVVACCVPLDSAVSMGNVTAPLDRENPPLNP